MVTVLRMLRVQTGETLRGFARTHGLNEVTLTKIERGQAYVPDGWRSCLAEALGVAVSDICDTNGWPRAWEPLRCDRRGETNGNSDH